MKTEELLDYSHIETITAMFDAYSQLNPTWGSLHVALDDNNMDRSTIEFCKKYALEHNDYMGALLADILLCLSDEYIERLKNEPQIHVGQIIFEFLLDR